jgi:uncharacterized protein YjaZ
MNKRVGLWFDLNKAVIVSITDDGEDTKRITSTMENYVRFSDNTPGDGSPEDVRDGRFWRHLNEYYDQVIAQIQDATAIQIFGPGDSKYELKKRLEALGRPDRIEISDSVDGLTNVEIKARVRAYFPARSQYNLS